MTDRLLVYREAQPLYQDLPLRRILAPLTSQSKKIMMTTKELLEKIFSCVDELPSNSDNEEYIMRKGPRRLYWRIQSRNIHNDGSVTAPCSPSLSVENESNLRRAAQLVSRPESPSQCCGDGIAEV